MSKRNSWFKTLPCQTVGGSRLQQTGTVHLQKAGGGGSLMTDFTLDARVHSRSTPANADCPYKDRWMWNHEHLVSLFVSAQNQFALRCRRVLFTVSLFNSDSQLPISPVSSPSVCQCACMCVCGPEIASSLLDTVTLSPGPRFIWRHAGETRSRGWR